MLTVKTKSECPYCKVMLEASTPAVGNSTEPQPGDYSICFSCSMPLVFDNRMSLRKPNNDKLLNMRTNKLFTAVRNQVAEFNLTRKPNH